jgi:hypothetical protein
MAKIRSVLIWSPGGIAAWIPFERNAATFVMNPKVLTLFNPKVSNQIVGHHDFEDFAFNLPNAVSAGDKLSAADRQWYSQEPTIANAFQRTFDANRISIP